MTKLRRADERRAARPLRAACIAAAAAAALLAAGAVAQTSASYDTLVPAGAVWRYRDTGASPGSGWMTPGFDDSAWASGPAQLGYGDADEATLVSFGPNPDSKYITTYFRHAFAVSDPSSYAALHLRLLCDDGAIAYVNGVEAARFNLPSGSIGNNTLASVAYGAAEESWFQVATLPASLLVAGDNIVAVAVHQANGTSSDLGFDLELRGGPPETLTRGPVLQLGTPASMTVEWRTNAATTGRVWFGPLPGAPNASVDEASAGTSHSVTLTGLQPGTSYGYAVGHTGGPGGTILAGGSELRFTTPPLAGAPAPLRLWAVGDSGTATPQAAAVRDAFLAWNRGAPDDWLMLGDNAYDTGNAGESQAAIFDGFATVLRQSVLWPARGNHDQNATVYFGGFHLPAAAEAGGVASGSEAYYSFDRANAHFACLDSFGSDRSVGGPMWTWLQCDLAASTSEWLIAYWHHPPYTKGSHDSDVDPELVEMRENFLPLLEAAGVDLVLCGHSHAYERSALIDGHYGLSTSFSATNVVQGGDGQPAGDGAYVKPAGPHEGTVYVVAGCAAKSAGGTLDHPALPTTAVVLGSVVLDIDGSQLDETLLDDAGQVVDSFRLVHSTPVAWSNVGGGLAAPGGEPVLGAEGTLQPGSALSLTLCRAPASAPVSLVVGFSVLGAPFKGGVLVPHPDLILAGLATNAAGTLQLFATWPGGVPSGAKLWMQAWLSPASGPCASNAIRGTTP